jgi:hypothetical protein
MVAQQQQETVTRAPAGCQHLHHIVCTLGSLQRPEFEAERDRQQFKPTRKAAVARTGTLPPAGTDTPKRRVIKVGPENLLVGRVLPMSARGAMRRSEGIGHQRQTGLLRLLGRRQRLANGYHAVAVFSVP